MSTRHCIRHAGIIFDYDGDLPIINIKQVAKNRPMQFYGRMGALFQWILLGIGQYSYGRMKSKHGRNYS